MKEIVASKSRRFQRKRKRHLTKLRLLLFVARRAQYSAHGEVSERLPIVRDGRKEAVPAREAERQLRGVQPLPARQAETQLRGVQSLPSREGEKQLRGVQPLPSREA